MLWIQWTPWHSPQCVKKPSLDEPIKATLIMDGINADKKVDQKKKMQTKRKTLYDQKRKTLLTKNTKRKCNWIGLFFIHARTRKSQGYLS